MIRIETEDGWILTEHREHARLAGRFGAHWGNDAFAPPDPRPNVLAAVMRHDDAWAVRDATPFLTREGRPSAFSRELVGTYSAFEEIDLADYLAVRGRAAEAVAAENPYAAVLISMHTVDLLTAQADLSGLSAADRALHGDFIARQQGRQEQLVQDLGRDPALAPAASAERRFAGFSFLQTCDSMSLMACVRFPRPIPLRRPQPRRDGTPTEILCTPLGDDTYRLSPFPLDQPVVELAVPSREVRGKTFPDLESFRAAYAAAPVTPLKVRIVS